MDSGLKRIINDYIKEDTITLMSYVAKALKGTGCGAVEHTEPEIDFNNDGCIAHFRIDSQEYDASYNVSLEYVVDGDDIFIMDSLDTYSEEIVQFFIDELEEYSSVKSSVKTNKRRRKIFAAGDNLDDYANMPNGDGDTNFEDNIDDLADGVNDMQDWLDGVEEDDVDIDIDANIANHYIVQCDGCHEVFISALVESDQQVEKISGVCPCCEKETDQYIKWIVRDVEFEEDLFQDDGLLGT